MPVFTQLRALPRSAKRLIARTSPMVAFTVAVLSMVVALGTTATAARVLTGDDIKNGSIKSADIKNRTLRAADIKNGTLTGKDVKNNTLKSKDIRRAAIGTSELRDGSVQLDDLSEAAKTDLEGDPGPAGPAGATGPAGPAGPAGPTEVVFGSDFSEAVQISNDVAPEVLDGAFIQLNLPRPGVIAVTFSAESRCYGGDANDWCKLDVLVDGTAVNGEDDDAFVSVGTAEEWWSTNSVTRTYPVPAGNHSITVRFGTTDTNTLFRLDDWNLVAEAHLD